ncbi:DoxX family protein [Polyangium sorediatum]|uniref:DoxX family protein n=1 Tax=Polyangium sorediatum TaxID=889274 RepID=A0ABT6NPK7_9BACT|nr:DoxX family protein [Polyangium sorediatum]MDI1430251.1 DoxX family protein [Polyangium sorediatum]
MAETSAGSRKLTIAGWALSGLVALFMGVISAAGKFIQPPPPGVLETAQHLGLPIEKYPAIGIVEIACVLLFLLPRTAFVGAILVAAYLGGATAIHVRVSDPWFMPPLMGVLAWIGYGLRRPDIIRAAFAAPSKKAD